MKTLHKIIILILVFFLNYTIMYPQDYEFEDFFEFVTERNVYYDSIRIANNDNMEGTGYTQFMRWQYFWQEAVFNDGGFDNTIKAKYDKYLSIINSTDEYSSINVEWDELGPLYCPGDKYPQNGYYYRIKGTGRCYFIEFDPQDSSKMFTGSPTGGLFYSIDGGESWQNGGTDLLPNPGIAHMKVNPFNSNAWYVATGEGHGYNNFSFSYGIFRTMNGGLTWESISNGLDIPDPTDPNAWWRNHCRKILFDPNNGNRLFAVFNTGIYKTENALANADLVEWDLVQSGYFKDIHFKPEDNSVMYASGESIFWSENSGNTWSPIPNLQQVTIPNGALVILRVTPANPDILYAAVIINSSNPDTEKLFKWDSNTQTWNSGFKMTDDGGMNIGRLALAVSPYDENVILRSHVNPVYKSNNSGENWSTISDNKHDDGHWICFGENENIVWIGTDGGINKSIDGGNSWINKTNNIGVANMHNIGSGKKKTYLILYGGYDTGTSLYEEYENEWNQMKIGGDSWECAIDDSDINGPPILYYTTQNGFHRSLDGGYSHNSISIPSNIGGLGWEQTFVMDYYNQNILYLLGMKRIGRSINQGDSWEQISPNAQELNSNRMWIKVWNSIDHPNYLYAHRVNHVWQDPDPDAFRLFKSSNCIASPPSSVSWIDVTPQNNNQVYHGWISDIAINEREPDKIWVCYQGYVDGNPKVLYFDGLEWIDLTVDINNTLNGYSVLTVEYQIGTSNDLIYIGTNAGVFYRSNDNLEWTKMEGIPHAQVTELEINYCSNKLRAATFGRGLWETDLIGFVSDITIYENETWDNHRLIQKNIVVPENITLTISGKVELFPQSKIIVERGAKLILDGGTLTNACDGLWKGIEVWGTSNQSQSYTYQGAVEIINGGTIENAICGIQTIRYAIPDGEGVEAPDYSYTGGMVLCDGGKFINNETAVKFWPYNYASSSSFFRDCQFITNNELIPGADVANFIEMKGISGVKIVGSSFTDSHSFTNPADLTTGILANDSRFYVWPYNEQPSVFTGLYYGIKSLTVDPVKTVNIENSQFINNLRSVYLSGISNASVILNQFNPWSASSIVAIENYCLYLDGCTAYCIEENDFINPDVGVDRGIGMIINNSGTAENFIYNNYFSDLANGVLAQNNNRSTTGVPGLQIKCNEFIGNGSDIAVTLSSPFITPTSGIAKYQGANQVLPDAPAGNLFSHTGPPGTPTDINNAANHVTYYYHNNPLYPLQPWYFTANTVKIFGVNSAPWNDQSCVSHLHQGGGGGGTGTIEDEQLLRQEMAVAEFKSDSVKSVLQVLEDGGSTEDLMWEVDLSVPPDAMEVYNELMNKSPYLSDTIVGSAIEKESVLVDAMIRDVMVANPQSSKSEELLQKLDERVNPVPEYMLGQILQGRDLVSTYEDLQSKLAFYSQQKAYLNKQLVRFYLNDTINPAAPDSLIALYSADNSLTSKYSLAFLLMEQGTGLSVLNAIPQQFTLSAEEMVAHQKMVDYYNLLAEVEIGVTDSLQTEALFSIISTENGSASVYARNMLLALNAIEYNEPIILPDMLKSSEAIEYEKLLNTAKDVKYLEVMPNPAKDYAIISWNLDKEPMAAKIIISGSLGNPVQEFSVTGIQDQKVLDTRTLKPGVYIATLYVNNKQLESVKFTIIK